MEKHKVKEKIIDQLETRPERQKTLEFKVGREFSGKDLEKMADRSENVISIAHNEEHDLYKVRFQYDTVFGKVCEFKIDNKNNLLLDVVQETKLHSLADFLENIDKKYNLKFNRLINP